jgi:FMN phosphatase YigB (HAD superfamily)
MKTILVDAIYTFVSDEGEMDEEMFKLLETYPNRKILLTGGDDEQVEKWRLKSMPYEFFTLKHEPDKSDPRYYYTMLTHFGFSKDDVVYFEHDLEAVESARSAGIATHHYDEDKKDLESLKKFLDENL